MSFFCCPCLNVSGRIARMSEEENSLKITTRVDPLKYNDFFKQSFPARIKSLTIRHISLVRRETIETWSLNHCLNCDSFTHCDSTANNDVKLINANLECGEDQLIAYSKSDKYSIPFKVILKDAFNSPIDMGLNDDANIKSLFVQLQAYTSELSLQTEAEIARLTKEMQERHERATKDFYRIAALVKSASESTKLTSNQNAALTPPVTPEGIEKLVITDKAQVAKPLNVADRFTARTLDDDIFEIEGMDYKHKDAPEPTYSDSEDETEAPHYRNRSGSINMARSAPITMPLFNHHSLEIDGDTKPANDHQMDIASSIKMLARSIHNEAIFGDLPRQLYNYEF